ncbi:hypothetical protein EVAR_16864_1 [Eumeta japonica]|uniref:Uncharacterized protein n=1 Tax=Eumeta variegata TaxID=151549 RepID=A0A4C1V1P1_EUMVA|nr:hypothetical protein EVAR_16864_1 [Eumeta japonica]
MGISLNIPRTCGILCLILAVNCVERVRNKRIVSFSIHGKSCAENCKYLLNVNGGEFLGHAPWRLTSHEGGACDIYSNYEINELHTEKWHTKVEVVVPNVEGRLYFCLQNFEGQVNPFGGVWVHQEEGIYLDPKNDVVSDIREGKIAMLWPARLQHKNGPPRWVKHYFLTEYRSEVAREPVAHSTL